MRELPVIPAAAGVSPRAIVPPAAMPAFAGVTVSFLSDGS